MARYIDADKFAERIRLSPAFKNMASEGDLLQKVVLDLLGNAPTADVMEIKHGYWREGRFLKAADSVKGYPSVICSDCGITFCDIINNHNYMYRYCPNCGAKMDGERK